jgi:peptidoglycan LD-endopeptidase CwlK
MSMTYEKRNRENISKLAPNTRQATEKWYEYCKKEGIDILIYETLRTLETQKQYVARGVSQTLKSYHLVGQALDFVPVVKGKAAWSGYGSADILKAVAHAKKLGFEWGGDWKSFVDKPHLQFNYKGYGTDKELDVAKPAPTPVKTVTESAKPAPAKYPLPVVVISRETKNNPAEVKQVQTVLNALGFKCGKVDGVWGKFCEDAMRRFQSMFSSLEDDGVYGPASRKVMLSELAKG